MRLVSAGPVVRSHVEAIFLFRIRNSNLNYNAVVVGVDYTNVLHDFGLDFGLKL